VEHWGAPDSALVVDVELREGSALDLEIMEVVLAPTTLLGPEPFRRPDDLAPNAARLSDRVILKGTILGSTQPGPAVGPAVSGEPAPLAGEPDSATVIPPGPGAAAEADPDPAPAPADTALALPPSEP